MTTMTLTPISFFFGLADSVFPSCSFSDSFSCVRSFDSFRFRIKHKLQIFTEKKQKTAYGSLVDAVTAMVELKQRWGHAADGGPGIENTSPDNSNGKRKQQERKRTRDIWEAKE